MEFIKKLKVNFDGEGNAVCITYDIVTLIMALSTEGDLKINTSIKLKPIQNTTDKK